MTLKKDTKVEIGDSEDYDPKAAVIAAIKEAEGEEGKVVTAEMIEDVTYVPSNKKVIVEVQDIYGGKTFTLDAVEIDTTPPKVVNHITDQIANGESSVIKLS